VTDDAALQRLADHETIAVPAPEAPIRVGSLPRLGVDSDSTPDLLVTGRLGAGGMGMVDSARQLALDRPVAIKRVLPGAPASAGDALIAEALTAGRLEHPNIVPIHQLGSDDEGRPVLVMKRVDGTPWSEMATNPEHPAWSRVDGDRTSWQINVLLQLCNAVEYAHERGVLHRDIKPQNVMIGAFGEVYLIDWGVASPVGETATPAGTPGFMSPEQFERATIQTGAADVFLLGATLYFALIGRAPNRGPDLQAVLRASSLPKKYPETFDGELRRILESSMAAEVSERFGSAADLRRALAAYLEHRAANRLADAANERLQAFTTALQRGDAAVARRCYHESRFAFEESLRVFPAGVIASKGRQACIDAMVRLELEQRHAAAARALIDELDSVPPSLSVALAELEEAVDAERAAKHQLADLRHQRDPAVASSVRRRVFVAFVVATFASAIGTGALERTGLLTVGPELGLFGVAVAFVVAVIIVAAFRRFFFGNRFNRELTLIGLMTLGAIVFNRSLAMHAGDGIAAIVVDDALIAAAIAGTTAVTVRPRFWVAAVLLAGAAVVGELWPQHALPVATVALCGSFISLYWAGRVAYGEHS